MKVPEATKTFVTNKQRLERARTLSTAAKASITAVIAKFQPQFLAVEQEHAMEELLFGVLKDFCPEKTVRSAAILRSILSLSHTSFCVSESLSFLRLSILFSIFTRTIFLRPLLCA